jgi:hypothetical protein
MKISVCLIKHHAAKKYGGVEARIYAFFASTLDGGECSVSRPVRFTPRERASGTHWIAGWKILKQELTPWKRENLLSMPGIKY